MKANNSFLVPGCGVIILLLSFSCTTDKELNDQDTIPGFYTNGPSGSWDTADWNSFHDQAKEESLLPVRPGEPGLSPFWNGYAKRFIHVPSFDFNELKGSVKYRYSATSDVNCETYHFEADHPRALLTPVWKKLPVGIVYLQVEGLDKDHQVTGQAGEKLFYKAAPFHGPYNLPVCDYTESVIRNMESLLELFRIFWRPIPRKAYEVTGKELYLAKAISLADNQTVAQDLAGGIYPTYQMDLDGEKRFADPTPGNRESQVWTGWLNCATVTAKALLELNELLEN